MLNNFRPLVPVSQIVQQQDEVVVLGPTVYHGEL